jgi:hypothetical protein
MAVRRTVALNWPAGRAGRRAFLSRLALMRVVADNASRTRVAMPSRLNSVRAIAACGGGAREAVKAQVVGRSDDVSCGSTD